MRLHDKSLIEAALRRHAPLHLYELGDLDDFFWPDTTWYASTDSATREMLLLYHGERPPVLLALTDHPDVMRTLLRDTLPELPSILYAHFSETLLDFVTAHYEIEDHGLHLKMLLTQPAHVDANDTRAAIHLTPADLNAIQTLYTASYPKTWFQPRMLETGMYFGIKEGEELLSIAGVHVYSPVYRVAALGNVTTHPRHRGQGLARLTCAKLCQALRPHTDHIGLNVKADNLSAIHCYESLGFAKVAEYRECGLKLKV